MYEYRARVVRVVDGDTVDLDIDLGLNVHVRERVRLYGINAPEVRGPERERGRAATEWLIQQAGAGDSVIVRTHKDKAGKFGRYLADLYLTEDATDSLNQMMVAAGHAVEAEY